MNVATPVKKKKTNDNDEVESPQTAILITPSPKKRASSRYNHDIEASKRTEDTLEPSCKQIDWNPSASASTVNIQENTRSVYALIQKMTGNIGGNGHGGAIYGELTMGSMQKLVDLMKLHTEFDHKSRFIDVGSGLGKPSIHVAQDPGVAFSYGIEMERVRWTLGLANLNQVLDLAHSQQQQQQQEEVLLDSGKQSPSTLFPSITSKIGYKCILEWGDVTSAKTFDPFTHVYMFDIGFPPALFKQLALMFNKSQSSYLICFHSPKIMIEKYGFDIELIVQASTSMHGSAEGHMGYMYRRSSPETTSSCTKNGNIKCDPRFSDAFSLVHENPDHIRNVIKQQLKETLTTTRPKRTIRAKRHN